ncbi:MAG TPA: hypothetical protein VNH22_07610 [Blastocatellia bacterium]|jgi:hypothetical protein|nr:hypothetical protein [Blastocatellia bacterium]
MINILSVNCELALAPYLAESLGEFIEQGSTASRVVRQGGSGLIIRSDGPLLLLRHQDREAALEVEGARHYRATVEFRRVFYSVERLSDEVVFTSVGRGLLLSHPQSMMWFDTHALSAILSAVNGPAGETAPEGPALPDWLQVSAGGGRLLISDRRTGRWVLLGSDHLSELNRRLESLEGSYEPGHTATPPTVAVKGLVIHLQSAFRLARALEAFAESGQVDAYEDAAPGYYLKVGRAVEGMELVDSRLRVGMTAREARKWAAIIRDELSQLEAEELERGEIRTVFARGEGGRWVLHAGDEVLVPEGMRARLTSSGGDLNDCAIDRPALGEIDGFTLLLQEKTGGCVALTREELEKFVKEENRQG